MEKTRALWFIAVSIACVVVLVMCLNNIIGGIREQRRSVSDTSFITSVAYVDDNGRDADMFTPYLPPVTYTDENGKIRSIADDPTAEKWTPPEDFYSIVPEQSDIDSDWTFPTD